MMTEAIETAIYFAAGIVIFLIAKIIRDITTPHDDDQELTTNDNPAFGLATAGYYLGVFFIFAGSTADSAPPPPDWTTLWIELGVSGAYAIGGMVLLNIFRAILDKALLPHFSLNKEIIGDRNVGVGGLWHVPILLLRWSWPLVFMAAAVPSRPWLLLALVN